MRKHVRRAQVDAGKREGLTTSEREELKRLRKENFELRRADTILERLGVVELGNERGLARTTPTSGVVVQTLATGLSDG